MISFATQHFDWIMAGLIAANVILFGVLTFVPRIHNKVTSTIINWIKKI